MPETCFAAPSLKSSDPSIISSSQPLGESSLGSKSLSNENFTSSEVTSLPL